MTFVDALAPYSVVNAWSLQPSHVYNVFMVIQNNSNFEAFNVHVNVSHSPFGIGLPGSTNNIIQPAPVNVPPKGPGGNGFATVSFQYLTPPGGHACLNAIIAGTSASIQQNTDVVAAPIGVPSKLSFLVFGKENINEVMTLTVKETDGNGNIIPVAKSYHPALVSLPGVSITPSTPLSMRLNLPANSFYSIGLNVTPPAGSSALHVFHVEGHVGADFVGCVDLRVIPDSHFVKPDPYVEGGYQSADIILYDLATKVPVPLGGLPSGPWDTLLKPDTDYGIAAIVHNSTGTSTAVNTVVRFWEWGNGVSQQGEKLIDIQTAAPIRPGEWVIVHSDKPFKSAPAGVHRCAAISIYNAQAATCPDASTFNMVPDPNANPTHSCSAWRNTDSKYVFIGRPWEFALEAFPQFDPAGPVEIKVVTQHVTNEWMKTEAVTKLLPLIKQSGIQPFCLSTLRKTLPIIDVKPVVTPGFKIKVARAQRAKFKIAGTVPANVKAGDKIVVHVTATYPATRESKAQDVEFFQYLYVKA